MSPGAQAGFGLGLSLIGMFGGPIGIMGAVLGAAIGYKQASAQASALARAAEISVQRINTEMLNARVNEIAQVQELSREAQVQMGAVQNASPDTQSHIEAIASSSTKVFAGRENLREALDQYLEAARARKRDIVESAEEGQPSAGLGGLSGGLAGLQMGMGLDAAMTDQRNAASNQSLMRGLFGAQTDQARAEAGLARTATRQSAAYNALLRSRLSRETAQHENVNVLQGWLDVSRSSRGGGLDLGQVLASAAGWFR